jgi:type IV pilus assembly protein PilV
MKSPARTGTPIRSRARGFTLIEVMVALVITAIGLLGIAKIQALAYASTGSAGMRSLVALEAAGLAATMHANRTYWSGLAPPIVTITKTTIDDATLNGAATAANYCTPAPVGNAPCDPPTLAAFDLHTYATALNNLLVNLNPITTITCQAITPTSCMIQVTWNEHAVSINNQSAAATTQTTFKPTYTLYVEP